MENIEIEKKYRITEKLYHKITNYFTKEKIVERIEKQNDIYFSPINFPFLGGEINNECLRLRILEDKNVLSYKKFIPKTNTEPSHCIEHELEINNIEKLKLILNDLRIEEVFTLQKMRKCYNYKDQIEVSLDFVSTLGYFLELEVINSSDIEEALKVMEEFTEKFQITEAMRNYDGYSYLLFNEQKNIKI